jgi:trigger factor
MNVEVENLPNCIASLRIELPPDRVAKEWDEVVRNFREVARIPGFRPGKAPPGVIEAKFRKQIQDQLTKKLVSETTGEAIREKGLKVLSISGVDDVEFASDKTMRFTTTLITAPEFELPEYKGIPVKAPPMEVTEEEVQRAIEKMRESRATFSDVEDRTLQLGDFAVIDYATLLNNQPLLEVYPRVPRMLSGGQEFWIKLDEKTFLEGFSDELVGMRPSETREFDLAVADNYPIRELVGQALHFNVTLKAIKSMQLPEVNDEFASQIRGGFTLDQLHTVLREDMTAEKQRLAETIKHNQIIDYLVSRVECELPQSYVKDETRRIMSEIVQENQRRGVTEEVLRENQKDIVNTASRNAKERLKANFILTKIAEKENISVSDAEFEHRIQQLADQYRMTQAKMTSELEDKGASGHVREEVLIGKVLDFLTSNANIEISSERPVNR